MRPAGDPMADAPSRPRLALVVTHPIQHFAPLYREAARMGELDLRVLFCCDWGVRAYFDALYDREVEWDVPLLEGYAHEFLPIRRRPRRVSFLGVDNPQVAQRLTAFSPDAVLVHGYGCRTMWRAVRWANRHGVPALLSSDSHAGAPVAAWKRGLKRLVVGSFYRRLSGALAVGESNRDYHRQFGMSDARLFPGVLPVDGGRLRASVADPEATRREIRRGLGIPESAVLALFCGNLTPWKRALDFVDAVQDAESAVWGVVVGDGPERARVEAATAAAGGRVRLAGFVNQSAIAGFYSAADVLVVPSERDAHPLVVTEALFFGLPILVSDAVGCVAADDTAQPGRNALVFPAGQVPVLTALLDRLAADVALRTRMGAESSAIAPDHDAPQAARLLAAAVREVVRLGPRRGGARRREERR